MNIKFKKSNIALAASAALLLSACSSTDDLGKADSENNMGKCHGGNACKGKSACATADSACAGQNACKGKGFITATKAECESKGGGWDKEKN